MEEISATALGQAHFIYHQEYCSNHIQGFIDLVDVSHLGSFIHSYLIIELQITEAKSDIASRRNRKVHNYCLRFYNTTFLILVEHIDRKISKNGEDLTMTINQLDQMDICRAFPQTKSDMYSFQVHEEHLLR